MGLTVRLLVVLLAAALAGTGCGVGSAAPDVDTSELAVDFAEDDLAAYIGPCRPRVLPLRSTSIYGSGASRPDDAAYLDAWQTVVMARNGFDHATFDGRFKIVHYSSLTINDVEAFQVHFLYTDAWVTIGQIDAFLLDADRTDGVVERVAPEAVPGLIDRLFFDGQPFQGPSTHGFVFGSCEAALADLSNRTGVSFKRAVFSQSRVGGGSNPQGAFWLDAFGRSTAASPECMRAGLNLSTGELVTSPLRCDLMQTSPDLYWPNG